MKRVLYKKAALALAFMMLLPIVNGCAEEREYPDALPESTATPPLNDGTNSATFTAQLYFVSEDGRKLYPEEQTLSYTTGVSRAEAAIEGLLRGPVSALLQRSVPQGLYLEHVELSLDVCNVYFTGTFPETMREWLTARAAIAATVAAAEGIGSVNVFFRGTEPGYEGRPLGTLSPVTDALDVYLKNMEQDYEVIPSEQHSEAVAYETHTATVYFADASRSLVAAKTTELTYAVTATGAEMVQLIFDKLSAGDPASGGLEPVLPADAVIAGVRTYYYGEEQPTVTPENANGDEADAKADANIPPDEPPAPQDGEKAFIIDIALEYSDTLSMTDQNLMCAALTLSLTSYVPGVDGVRISRMKDGYAEPLCEDYFERSDFVDMIGHGVTLFYPDEEGASLVGITRIVEQASAYDPEVRIRELLTGPADPGVTYPGFTADDIESVYISGDTAVVNWNDGFSDRLRSAIEDASSAIPAERRELMFIYGVINTLCELPYVSRVWMTENGNKIGTIDTIYLGNPLVMSPGLIAEE